jgi:hypothetical protein
MHPKGGGAHTKLERKISEEDHIDFFHKILLLLKCICYDVVFCAESEHDIYFDVMLKFE